MQLQKPLIYIAGIAPSRYLVAGPAYIVNDDPQHLVFTVQVDDPSILRKPHDATTAGEIALRRRYITTEVQQRVHQRTFRERVLKAYQEQCAICGERMRAVPKAIRNCVGLRGRLRHQELLDAAHILPEDLPKGDRNILGVTPELKVEVRLDVLEEKDGPMLEWGLQHFHGADLYVPRRPEWQPNREFVASRYEAFQKAY